MSAAPLYKPANLRTYGFELVEPKPWPRDEGLRREPVIDPNFEPPRVVRLVGWRRCMRCEAMFFSPDVRGVRLHENCAREWAELL